MELIDNVILAITSATIFWFFFSYLPSRKRLNKIRPKVNQDLESITKNLYDVFSNIFKNTRSINIMYNIKISSGTLNKEDIETGLLNKCYN